MFGCDQKKNQYLLYSVVETFVSKQRSEKGWYAILHGGCMQKYGHDKQA
jgi:hypothetical protein